MKSQVGTKFSLCDHVSLSVLSNRWDPSQRACDGRCIQRHHPVRFVFLYLSVSLFARFCSIFILFVCSLSFLLAFWLGVPLRILLRFFFGFFFSHYSRFGVLIIISNRFITLSFTCTSDEEREAKPKKRRKRTKELPKEDSSDDGNNDVNTFNMEHRLFLVMCLSSSCEVAVIQKKFKKTARRVCSDDKRTT